MLNQFHTSFLLNKIKFHTSFLKSYLRIKDYGILYLMIKCSQTLCKVCCGSCAYIPCTFVLNWSHDSRLMSYESTTSFHEFVVPYTNLKMTFAIRVIPIIKKKKVIPLLDSLLLSYWNINEKYNLLSQLPTSNMLNYITLYGHKV